MASTRKYIAELNGYLNAISDLNDQVGFRHGYFAGIKKIGALDPVDRIESMFGAEAVENLRSSNRRDECNLIKSYALCNAAGADQMDSKARKPSLTETIVWRIQQYLNLDDYCNETIHHRWISSFSERGFSCRSTFLSTASHLVWVVFSTRHDDISGSNTA